MKKITFLLLFCVATVFVYGQKSIEYPGISSLKEIEPFEKRTKNFKAADFYMGFEEGSEVMTTIKADANVEQNIAGIDFSMGWRLDIVFTTNPNNVFAASTSYFDPPGQADRWLFTPAITLSTSDAILSWAARSYDIFDGDILESYEVYITSSIAGATPAPSDFGTPVLTVTDESDVWSTTVIDLAEEGYSEDMTIYVAWRHISDDCYLLLLDDIYVGTGIENDLNVKTSYVKNTPNGYMGIVPYSQMIPVEFSQVVSNVGSEAQTGVTLSVNLFDGMYNTVFYEISSSVTIDSGESDSLVITDSFIVPPLTIENEEYTAVFNVNQNEPDENPHNNIDTVSFVVSETLFSKIYAPNLYINTDNLGVYGAEDGLVVGNKYPFISSATINGISIGVWSGTSSEGVSITGKLYSYPNMDELASTNPYNVTSDDITNVWINIPFPTPYTVNNGETVFAGVEMIYGSNTVQVLCQGETYFPETSMYYMPNGNEGPGWYSLPFPTTSVSIIITPIDTKICQVNNIENISVFPNPTSDILTIKNAEKKKIELFNILGKVIYSLENASSNQIIDVSNLSVGTYLIKIDTEVFKINIIR